MAKSEIKVLWNDLRANPALLIVVIVIIAAILWYVYKQNQGNNAAPPATQQQPQIIIPPSGPPGPQGPPGPTTTTTVNMLAGKTRPKTNKDQNASGVPVYGTAGGKTTRFYPFDTSVNIIGTTDTVNGRDYYPIQGGGWIREIDLIGFG